MKVEKGNNFITIANLFRKIISATACIEKTTNNEDTKQTSVKFMMDFIDQFEKLLLHKDVNEITFKFSEKEIVDFANDCYDKVDIFLFAEELEFGFSELIEGIQNKK